MRLIDADELMEHAARDKLDTRELIMQMIENAPTVHDNEKEALRAQLNMAVEINGHLNDEIEKERALTRNVVQMVMNFQRK